MTPSRRVLASIAVALLLLALLMAWGGVSPREVIATIRGLPPRAYAAALALHLVTYFLRAVRFQALLPRAVRPALRRTFIVSSAHNLASYVLPAKTGEAAFPVYLKLHCGVGSSKGLAALVVSRFLDGAMLSTGLAVSCLWIRHEGRHPQLQWLGYVGAMGVAVTLVFLVLSVRGDLLVRSIARVLFWLRVHHLRFGEKVLLKSNSLALALRESGDRGRLPFAILATVPLWFTVFGFYFLLSRAMGMPKALTLLETGFGAALAAAFNLLPVNGFAGMGTQEIGWVTGFNQLLGYDADLVLRVGVGVHLIQLFNIVALGLCAHVAMGFLPRLRFQPGVVVGEGEAGDPSVGSNSTGATT